MIGTKRRTAQLVAVIAATGIVLAACSSSSSSSSTTAASGGGPSAATDVTATLAGSGATFPKAFYEEAIQGYKGVAPNVTVTYGGGGSGQGQTDLQGKVVQWAGSDGIVKPEDLPKYTGGTFLYFPTVAAPITVSYNLSGVENLQLSPQTIAGIFQRQITTWNASEIAADNPGVSLPSTPIKVVRRSDGSGTTENFSKFLVAAAPNWTLGSGKELQWPADAVGEKGNDGVAAGVKRDAGSIGYVDYSDAVAGQLSFAAVKNKDGQYVEPSLDSASAALAGATINPDLTYNPLNAPGAGSYPITAPTWVLVYQNQPDQATVTALQSWITYLLTDGQQTAEEVDFAPLPSSLQQQALAQVSKITVGS